MKAIFIILENLISASSATHHTGRASKIVAPIVLFTRPVVMPMIYFIGSHIFTQKILTKLNRFHYIFIVVRVPIGSIKRLGNTISDISIFTDTLLNDESTKVRGGHIHKERVHNHALGSMEETASQLFRIRKRSGSEPLQIMKVCFSSDYCLPSTRLPLAVSP